MSIWQKLWLSIPILLQIGGCLFFLAYAVIQAGLMMEGRATHPYRMYAAFAIGVLLFTGFSISIHFHIGG
jgi:hypothetical protein